MSNQEIIATLRQRIKDHGLDLEVAADPVVGVFFEIRDSSTKDRCRTQTGAAAIFPFNLMGAMLASEVIGAYAALRS
jgi:hypothetical protein